MKNIQAIALWKDGRIQNASILDMYISYDDLKSQATFQYSLMDHTLSILAQGQFTMGGDDYNNWDNSNESAYLYAANLLNLIISGDYSPISMEGDTLI